MTASPAGRQIGLHREMPHPGVGLGHRHNRPGLQGVGVGFEDGEEPAEHPLRPHVPQPEDDDARSGGAGNGNQVREVEVVGDNDSRLGARERHDLAIRQPGITPVVEMHGVMPQGPQACGSLGCDPHVAQQLHAGAVSLGSTVSSASQAT